MPTLFYTLSDGFPPLEKGGQGGFNQMVRFIPFKTEEGNDLFYQIPLNPPFSKGEAEAYIPAADEQMF